MKQSKSKNAKSANPRDMKNVATETIVDFHNLEMIKLQDQIKLLQLENNILRQNLQELEKKVSDDTITSHMQGMSQLTPMIKSSVGKSNCGCKGNCSSKICGCMKKNNKCNLLCKCDVTICQNQKTKHSDENKENTIKNDMETPKKPTRKTKKNGTAKETKNKNLSNPQECKNSEVTFDPMKPKHQLSRTPPNMKKVAKEILIKKDAIKSQSQSQPQSYKSIEETKISVSPNTQGLAVKEEAVDWEQHTAQLVPCKKCKRTFMPNRIQKHEACCKKI